MLRGKLQYQTLVLFLIWCGTFAGNVSAATLIYSDIDDTLFESREQLSGTFSTPLILFRIPFRSTTTIELADGPEKVEVSPAVFERIKKYLGTSRKDTGITSREVTLDDGSVIKAGYYEVRDPESYAYYNPAPAGKNHFLRNIKDALKNTPTGKTWQGPFWKYAKTMLKNAKLAARFRMVTARGQSREELKEGFLHLRHKKEIDNLPDFRHSHSVTRPEYDEFSLDHVIPEAKAQLMEEAVLSLRDAPWEDEDFRLGSDGKSIEQVHYVIYADNNQETLENLIARYQDIVRKKKVRVKLAIFNAGYASDIVASGRPQYAIMKWDGTFRAATEAEMVGEPADLRKFSNEQLEAAGCNGRIAAETLANRQ